MRSLTDYLICEARAVGFSTEAKPIIYNILKQIKTLKDFYAISDVLIYEDCDVEELTDALDPKNIDKYANEFVGMMCDPNNYMRCTYQVFDILGFSPARIRVPKGPRSEDNTNYVISRADIPVSSVKIECKNSRWGDAILSCKVKSKLVFVDIFLPSQLK